MNRILHVLFSLLLLIPSTLLLAQNTVLVAPSDVVVSREFTFDLKDLSILSNKTFGQLVKSTAERDQILTFDLVCDRYCIKLPCIGYEGFTSNNPLPKPVSNVACDYFNQYFDSVQSDKKYMLDWGLDGYYLNAGVNIPSVSIVDNRVLTQDKKSSYGSIVRIYSLLGLNNVTLRDSQTIWVVDCNYDPTITLTLECIDRIQVYLDTNCCVTLTADMILSVGAYKCWDSYHIEARSWITNQVIDRDSRMKGVQLKYEDIGHEFKITVRDPETGNSCWGLGTVLDTIAPVIIPIADTCEIAKYDSNLKMCLGHVTLSADVKDNCSRSENIKWSYKLDLFNDGIGVYNGFDYQVGPLSQKQFQKGDTSLFSNNPFADNNKLPFVASGTYPIGNHKILWTLIDEQVNRAEKEFVFDVKDCQAPMAICYPYLPGISVFTVPLPTVGCIDIYAQDLNNGSFDNCTSDNNLKFYFNGDISKIFITICCDKFVEAKANVFLPVDVELWVEDEEGNKDSCKTTIIVTDGNDVCPDFVRTKELGADNLLTIFPNPSSGTIYIKSIATIDQINVIDFAGIQYSSFEIFDHHTLTISDLPGGFYIIEAFSHGNKIASKKVIIL